MEEIEERKNQAFDESNVFFHIKVHIQSTAIINYSEGENKRIIWPNNFPFTTKCSKRNFHKKEFTSTTKHMTHHTHHMCHNTICSYYLIFLLFNLILLLLSLLLLLLLLSLLS